MCFHPPHSGWHSYSDQTWEKFITGYLKHPSLSLHWKKTKTEKKAYWIDANMWIKFNNYIYSLRLCDDLNITHISWSYDVNNLRENFIRVIHIHHSSRLLNHFKLFPESRDFWWFWYYVVIYYLLQCPTLARCNIQPLKTNPMSKMPYLWRRAAASGSVLCDTSAVPLLEAKVRYTSRSRADR